jgi:hypothetical protein
MRWYRTGADVCAQAVIAIAIVALLAWSARAQEPSGAAPAAYLPLVLRATNTPTNTATATATATATSTPQLPPPSYNTCQADPNPGAAPNYPMRINYIDKADEAVTLQNVSGSAIDLTGWRMCSITGNQHHPIGGTIQPGEALTFFNTGGPIWNNADPDPGALYTPDGRLASYRDA